MAQRQEQPRRSEETSGDTLGSRNSLDMKDWDCVSSDEAVVVGESDTEQPSQDKELEKPRATKEQMGGKDDGLCRQASQSWPTESGEFQSARSTPYSSMTSETATHDPITPTTEQQEREMEDAMFSRPEGLPNSVSELQQELFQQSIQFQKAEKRARYFEAEYHKATRNLVKLKRDLQEKDEVMKNAVGELEKTDAKMKSIQQHSKSQSQQILVLHNEAKERDAEIHEVRLATKELEGKIDTLEGEREAKDLELEQSRRTLRSLGEQVKKLTTDNASLLDRMRKFGGLQNESRELSTKAGKLQEELKKVSAERDELKFLLEATQAQAKVYEEDFKTERDDRTRAFAEREKEGERYREEIERLQIQLKSHKGNLTDLEIIHMARQRELMQAMDDLKKCQEEVQAKTSQVKQYKKQHDGLVTKVATLEREKKELAEQFEMARQQVEQRSKKKAKAAHAEGEQAHAELAKQVNHYRAKSQARKAELAKMTAAYAKARQELLNVKKEVKKEKKKTAVISNPVNQSELHELCRNLQFDKEELKDQIKALMETNPKLYESWSALEDADTGSVGSPTELEFPPSPDDEASNSLAVASEVSTSFSSTTKSTGSRPRSSTFSGISRSPKPTGGNKPTPHYFNIPGATTSVRTDIQHADYVNQIRIQAMLANYQQSDAVPASPPGANSLPAPIMVFTEDSANQRGSKLSSVPWSVPPSGASGVGSVVGGGLGGVGVEGQGRERRGSAPTWGSNDPDNLPALHDRQHQLQSNPYGHASLRENRRPVPTPRKEQPASQPRSPVGPTSAEREMMMKQEEKRQAGEILTPGIATEMHRIAHDVIEEMEEGGGHEVTGTPYDPNLTCVICQKMFRIGEIQLYRTHTENCVGAV